MKKYLKLFILLIVCVSFHLVNVNAYNVIYDDQEIVDILGEDIRPNIIVNNYSTMSTMSVNSINEIVLDKPGYSYTIEGDNVVLKANINRVNNSNNVIIQKVLDLDNSVKLEGAEFTLYDSNNNVLKKGITDNNGLLTFTLDNEDIYYISETKNPIGYTGESHSYVTTKFQKSAVLNSSTNTFDITTNVINIDTNQLVTNLNIVNEKIFEAKYEAQTGGTVSNDYDSYYPYEGLDNVKGSEAYPDNGYTFDGWYIYENRVSDDPYLDPKTVDYYLNMHSGFATFTAKFITIPKYERYELEIIKQVDETSTNEYDLTLGVKTTKVEVEEPNENQYEYIFGLNIEDVLSDALEFINENYQIYLNDELLELDSYGYYSLPNTIYNPGGGTITVLVDKIDGNIKIVFDDSYFLEPNYEYKVVFKIKVKDSYKNLYDGRIDGTSDDNTGTYSNKDGIWSNINDDSKVSFIKGFSDDGTAEYETINLPKPVIKLETNLGEGGDKEEEIITIIPVNNEVKPPKTGDDDEDVVYIISTLTITLLTLIYVLRKELVA